MAQGFIKVRVKISDEKVLFSGMQPECEKASLGQAGKGLRKGDVTEHGALMRAGDSLVKG